METGKNTGGVIVVKELAAEFQIELASELIDALPNARRLGLQILLIVKTDGFHRGSPFKNKFADIVAQFSFRRKINISIFPSFRPNFSRCFLL